MKTETLHPSEVDAELPIAKKLKNMRKSKSAQEMEYWATLAREEVLKVVDKE